MPAADTRGISLCIVTTFVERDEEEGEEGDGTEKERETMHKETKIFETIIFERWKLLFRTENYTIKKN